MVAIRDVDITALEEQARINAIELAEQEYDLLRLWQLPYVMPAIDLRYFQGHLFMIAGMASGQPGQAEGTKEQKNNSRRLYTLQDFLQSGQGLPSEQRALEWMQRLCLAVDRLHRHQIVIGDLDPYTIILNENSEAGQPVLMVSWLLTELRKWLPLESLTATKSYFTAPEVLGGKAEPRSDVYSLGAILYLLLTGTVPESGMAGARAHPRAPQEVNQRISVHVSECVMQALSPDPVERFQSAEALAQALRNPNPRYRRTQASKQPRQNTPAGHAPDSDESNVETVRIVPLSRKYIERWQAARPQTATQNPIPHRPAAPRPAYLSQQVEAAEGGAEQQHAPQALSSPPPATPPVETSREDQVATAQRAGAEDGKASSQRVSAMAAPIDTPVPTETAGGLEAGQQQPASAPAVSGWKRITGRLPAITSELLAKRGGSAKTAAPAPAREQAPAQPGAGTSWLKQLQNLVLGQQQHAVAAAAILETPLRVLPGQMYTIRLHIMGRDAPSLPPGAKKGEQAAGLSALVQGDRVLIEVRSALQQSYAFVVQRAVVTIPAADYAAEVTIPIQPLANGQAGRRDRLYIFFLDEARHPLYEKPFVVEVFVSHHVRRGQEGHHVLTVPL